MDEEDKNEAESFKGSVPITPASPTLSTPPTLNLMEQILLAKIEKQSLREDDRDANVRLGKKNSLLLRRTDSMDSQNSASTYNSFLSSDSASSGNFYCKCDDCLLGIVDDYQRSPTIVGRKKVRFFLLGQVSLTFWRNFYFFFFLVQLFKVKTSLATYRYLHFIIYIIYLCPSSILKCSLQVILGSQDNDGIFSATQSFTFIQECSTFIHCWVMTHYLWHFLQKGRLQFSWLDVRGLFYCVLIIFLFWLIHWKKFLGRICESLFSQFDVVSVHNCLWQNLTCFNLLI